MELPVEIRIITTHFGLVTEDDYFSSTDVYIVDRAEKPVAILIEDEIEDSRESAVLLCAGLQENTKIVEIDQQGEATPA